jgi:hypothetical protein
MKMDSRINQTSNETLLVICPYTAKTAKVKPKEQLPTSPINIFAGAQFHTRKPDVEETIVTQTMPANMCPDDTKNNAPNNAVLSACTPASPSVPSIKLYRLTSHAIQNTEMKLETQYEVILTPPIESEFTPPNNQTAHTELTKYNTALIKTGTSLWISNQPITPIRKTPDASAIESETASLLNPDKMKIDNRIDKLIANPPPVGVGIK